MSGVAFKTQFSQNALEQSKLAKEKFSSASLETPSKSEKGANFVEMLKDGIEQVNEMQKTSDKMSTNLATGKTENIHETMLAISHAELSFKLMVQIRNKALEAYQEIMRMQV